MNPTYKRKFPTNREFSKRLKFNNYEFILKSVFDSYFDEEPEFNFNEVVNQRLNNIDDQMCTTTDACRSTEPSL